MADLQISIVVLTEELHEAQDRLHDGDDDAHFALFLALIGGRDRRALGSRLVLFSFSFTPVSRERLLGDSGGLN